MHASWYDWQSRKHERNVKEEQDSWVEWLAPAALSGGIVSGPMKPPEKLIGLNLSGMILAVVFLMPVPFQEIPHLIFQRELE